MSVVQKGKCGLILTVYKEFKYGTFCNVTVKI